MIPAREYTSASEILAARAALRKRLFSPHTAPRTSAEPKDQPVKRIYMTAPVERVWREQQDSHMAAYYEWKGNEPLGFLKLRCREEGISYADIVGSSSKRVHSDPRSALMAEIKLAFPDMSLPSLGRLFGGRDHTSCLTALRKRGVIAARQTIASRGIDITKMKEMYDGGHTYREIASAVGHSYTTICNIVKEQGWERNVARGIASHAATIRQMFDNGESLRAIGKAVGHSRDGISVFVKRMGWSR